MKNMKRISLVLSVVALLAACDAVTSYYAEMAATNQPTVVFSPGYKIMVDGKPVPIAGFDDCPKTDPIMVKVIGESRLDGSHDCIVIEKDRKNVSVQVGLAGGTVTEQWTIVH